VARLGRQAAALLVCGALVAAGCSGDGRQDTTRPAATGAPAGPPPATRSAAYGKPCLHGRERAAAFRFRVGQGLDTVGLVLGRGANGLVFGHQLGGDLCEWLETARAYARLGYRSLVLDFHDRDRVDDDVVAAVAELRRRGVARVVLVGSSMGGTAALVAAARIRPAVAGVVSLSAPAVFGDPDARRPVARLRVPALFMAARRDGPFPAAARGLYGAAATPDKRLLVVAGRAHGAAMLQVGGDAAQARAALRGFVAAHL
jgi:pimeloyl-ACP methyl ester carboxylesterase